MHADSAGPSHSTSPALRSEDSASRLRDSFLMCRAITRRAKSSFPLAFLMLPREKRRAMDALYAFMRITDDLADDEGDLPTKRERLREWRASLHTAFEGDSRSPILPAVVDTVNRFHISLDHLLAVIDGVEMDLEPVRFATFDDLYPYLFRVASAVGLACLPVWGFRDGVSAEDVCESAEAAGIAFQLTNILRDLGEDLDRGRVYLPQEDLDRFDCPPEAWRDPQCQARFRDLMAFQIERARHYYRKSEPLAKRFSADGRGIYHAMSRTYRELLESVAASSEGVLTHRVRLSRWRKLRALLSAWPARWGW